jgi:hypothetical protein
MGFSVECVNGECHAQEDEQARQIAENNKTALKRQGSTMAPALFLFHKQNQISPDNISPSCPYCFIAPQYKSGVFSRAIN